VVHGASVSSLLTPFTVRDIGIFAGGWIVCIGWFVLKEPAVVLLEPSQASTVADLCK
jgi:hypothetical protein